MTARRAGDDWILNGEKTFITNGDEADFAIVVAITDPDSPVGRGGASAFLVDRAMGWTSRPIDTMGVYSPASLVFQDVRVPGRNILGGLGQGFELGMRWITRGRYIIPSYALGIAERALAMSIEYANTRTTFGQPIGRNQAIQWMIADSETELEAARALVLRAAWTVDQGRDPRHAAAHAALRRRHGEPGRGPRDADPRGDGLHPRAADRTLHRQVRLFRIFEGTDEMQRLIISRDLLRGYTTVGLPST